jgi:hypothetical protein
MNIQGMFLERPALSPNAIEHLLTRKHTIWGSEETLQDGKLYRRERNELPIDPHFMLVEVHAERPRHQDLLGSRLYSPSAKQCADLRHNLTGRLLRHDIVGARLEVLHILLFRTASIHEPE